MRNLFVSTLTAIALAVPLGIGGFTLTATVTASDAEANRIRHHFNTCSRDVIWKCHSRVQSAILFNGNYNQLFPSRRMPERANGLDQATFGTLEWQYTNNWGPAQGTFAGDYLREFFSDADVVAWNEGKSRDERFRYTNDGISLSGPGAGIRVGYISPDERAPFDAIIAREAEQRRAREEEQRLFNILNSRDEARIARHFCDKVEGVFRDYIPQGSKRNNCQYDGGVTNRSEYRKYFDVARLERISSSIARGLHPDIRQQYQVGVPLSNLFERFRRDCEFHNGEFKPAPADHPVIKNATCGGIIGQNEDGTQNRYKVTEFTGWDYRTPNVYTRRHGDLLIPVDVSYTDYEEDTTTGLQVAQISPVTLADLNSSVDETENVAATRGIVVENRETIVDLVDNVNENEGRLFALEPLVEANSLVIENLGNSLASLASEVATLTENVEENRAGVALALAIPRSGLQNEERFRLSAGVGNFKGESALGVGIEFRISPQVSFSTGGGFSQQGSSGVRAEISYGW